MKHQFIRALGVFCLILLAVTATAGTWSANNFFYQPEVGARGTTEKNNFDAGLNRVDAHLGRYKTLGDPGYSTLAEALTTIGGNNVTLTIPATTVTVASNTTIGNNIALRVFKGGKFSVNSGVTLTINGPIDAGPYQIFSGSGSVTLGGVSTIYDVWYASPPSTPLGNVAAPVGSSFIKTSGSAPLVFVKESGTGTSGWVANSGGSGATAFTVLTDVPSSYSGQAGKALRVNSSSNGLEFYSPSSSDGVKPFITYGESGYATLSQALTTIGSTETTLVIPAEAGAVPITCTTTIGKNITLKIESGAYFDIANGVNLNIESTINAGPYKIFQWTGTGKIDIHKSPTQMCPLPWWGALEGQAHDCSAAISKAMESIASGQTLFFPRGDWRITSPLTFDWKYVFGAGPTFKGVNWSASRIYIDVGSSNDALTFKTSRFHIEDMAFVGPANCCKNGVVNTINDTGQPAALSFRNVRFYMGCTEFALKFAGVVYTFLDNVDIGHNSYDWSNVGRPANGIILYKRPVGEMAYPLYGNNVIDMRGLYISGMGYNGSYYTGIGLKIENGLNIRVSGSIEATGYPIYITGGEYITFDNLYAMDGNHFGIIVDNDGKVNQNEPAIDFIEFNNVLALTGDWSYLKSAKNIKIVNSYFKAVKIEASCQDVTLNGLTVYGANSFIDDSTNTCYVTPVRVESTGKHSYLPSPNQGTENLWFNSGLERFNGLIPDGLSVGTAAIVSCGVGKTDTTRHWNPLCIKVNTNGSDQYFYNYFTADQLAKLRGQTFTVGAWVKPTAVSKNSLGVALWISQTVPDWAASKNYQVGECVKRNSDNGYIYKCVTAGTSGSSQPDFPASEQVTGESIGTGNGVTDTFNLHNKYVVSVTAKVNGVTASSILLTGTGPSGVDQIKFTTPPAAGTTVTADYRNESNGRIFPATDGTVKWQAMGNNTISDVQIGSQASVGKWNLVSQKYYLAPNATAANARFIFYRGVGDTNVDSYFADPFIVSGITIPNGPFPGLNENNDFLIMGPIKVTWGPSASGNPTGWRCRGDQHWWTDPTAGQSPGVVATADGSPATWKAMGNLAN